jgi:hypothetical protein
MEFSQQAFKKPTNIIFYENTSTGRRVDPFGQMGRKIDKTKLTDTSQNFVNMPKN